MDAAIAVEDRVVKRLKRPRRETYEPPHPVGLLVPPVAFGMREGAFVERFFSGWGDFTKVLGDRHIRAAMLDVIMQPELEGTAVVAMDVPAQLELARRAALRSSLWSAVALGAIFCMEPKDVVDQFLSRANAALRDCYDCAHEDVLRAYVLLSNIHVVCEEPKRFVRLVGFAGAIAESITQERLTQHAVALRQWESEGRCGSRPVASQLEEPLAFLLELFDTLAKTPPSRSGPGTSNWFNRRPPLLDVCAPAGSLELEAEGAALEAVVSEVERRGQQAPLTHVAVVDLVEQHQRREMHQQGLSFDSNQLSSQGEQEKQPFQPQDGAAGASNGGGGRRLAAAARVVSVLARLEARAAAAAAAAAASPAQEPRAEASAPQLPVVFVASDHRLFELLMGLDVLTLSLASKLVDGTPSEHTRQEVATAARALREVARKLAGRDGASRHLKSSATLAMNLGGYKLREAAILLELMSGYDEGCVQCAREAIEWLERYPGVVRFAPVRHSIHTLAFVLAAARNKALYSRLVRVNNRAGNLTHRLPEEMDDSALSVLRSCEYLRCRCACAILSGPRSENSPLVHFGQPSNGIAEGAVAVGAPMDVAGRGGNSGSGDGSGSGGGSGGGSASSVGSTGGSNWTEEGDIASELEGLPLWDDKEVEDMFSMVVDERGFLQDAEWDQKPQPVAL